MPAPLAALAAKLGPIVAQMAIGTAARGGAAAAGSRVPMGLTMAQGRMKGMGLSSMPPQRIGAGDVVGGGGGSGGGILSLAKNATTAAAALATMPPIIKRLGDRFSESQRSLAQYNGTIAAAFARLDVNRMVRDVRVGSQTSGSTQKLTEAIDRFEQAATPIRIAFINFANTVIVPFLNMATEVVDKVGKAVEKVDQFAEKFGLDLIEDNPKSGFTDVQFQLSRIREEFGDWQRRGPALDLKRPNEN